ncbi:hypothetical protein HPB51_015843 [Rhipicephalus microplus]|uniref:Uncharacterized protein n=1 Tax=Rhipicephalus microplus TaxID=6941 RepID=A0A9J6DH54_RHIMP|nr:hypothetical protein HPB51_015843 [Rhipicephalus microplus]
MTEPRPTATATPAAAESDPLPEGERPAENAAAAPPLHPDNLFSSSQDELVYDEFPDTRSLFFIAWVFCCVGSIIIFVPMAFILMPLFSGAIARVAAPAVDGGLPQTPAPESMKAPTTTVKFTAPTWTVPSTATAKLPASCLKTRPTIAVDINQMKVNSYNVSTLRKIDTSKVEVYCIFNITRVHRGTGFDFLLNQFPWPVCPNVIYWSFSVNLSDGRLLSRAPELDEYTGFYNISSIARLHNADANVLFTVGGYPEDGGLFTVVGSGTLAEATLAQSMIMVLYRLQFTGVNIHLVEDPPCEQYFKNRMAGLQSFITVLKKLVGFNRPIQNFKITLMVGTNKNIAKEALAVLGDVIDRLFVDTFALFSNNFSSSFNNISFCHTLDAFMFDLANEISSGTGMIGPSIRCVEATISKTGRGVIAIAYLLIGDALADAFRGKCLSLYDIDYGVHPKLDACVGRLSRLSVSQWGSSPSGARPIVVVTPGFRSCTYRSGAGLLYALPRIAPSRATMSAEARSLSDQPWFERGGVLLQSVLSPERCVYEARNRTTFGDR